MTFKKGTSVWISDPVYYWPSYNLDFYAFYPITVKPTAVADPTIFNYTVAPSAANEFDVVMSYTGNQSRVNSPVDMEFHHALSKINFIITTWKGSGLNIKVDSIGMRDVPMQGTFTFDITATAVPNYFQVTDQTAKNNATISLTTPVTVTASDCSASKEENTTIS